MDRAEWRSRTNLWSHNIDGQSWFIKIAETDLPIDGDRRRIWKDPPIYNRLGQTKYFFVTISTT